MNELIEQLNKQADELGANILLVEPLRTLLREAAAALSGREAVGHVLRDVSQARIHVNLPEGTPLYTTPQPGDGWRPIAEAPKDGTPLLGLWLPSPGAYYRITGANYGIVAFDDDAQLWVLIDEADMTAEVAAPDLFQPLPAAPSAKGVA